MLRGIEPVVVLVNRPAAVNTPAWLRIGSPGAPDEVDGLRGTVTELVQCGVLPVPVNLCLPRLFLEVAEVLVDTVQRRDARIHKGALAFMRFQIKQAGIKQFPGDVAKVWDVHSNLKRFDEE